jgi:hypothetical protein
VAAVLNFDNSGWQMDDIRVSEGLAGSVQQASLNREAVILPDRILDHNRDLLWPRVRFSPKSACSGVTLMTHSDDFNSSSE